MSQIIDDYNANECCKSLNRIRKNKKSHLKNDDILTDSQVLIRALQLKIAKENDKKVSKKGYDSASSKIRPITEGKERELLTALITSNVDKSLVRKIRKKKVNRKEVQLLCARLSDMINSDSLDMDECKTMYEARYMVRTLQRRIDDMCAEKEDVPFDV